MNFNSNSFQDLISRVFDRAFEGAAFCVVGQNQASTIPDLVVSLGQRELFSGFFTFASMMVIPISIVFAAGTEIITQGSCPYPLALRYLLCLFVAANVCWLLGGALAVGLATLSPELF